MTSTMGKEIKITTIMISPNVMVEGARKRFSQSMQAIDLPAYFLWTLNVV
jgi:hypothetical protein